MLRRALLLLLILMPALLFGADGTIADSQLVLLKSDSPLIAFRIQFLTGSAKDQTGKEGIASLTASVLAEGSTTKNDYQKILKLLYPTAASFNAQVDKEMTTFYGVVHKDNLSSYYELFRDSILSPAFKKEDFERLKTDQLNYVAKGLRFNDDEELGKETLNWALFKNHPYGHPNAGMVSTNRSITLEDVQAFYKQQYARANLVIGVAGNYPDTLIEQIKKDFAALPATPIDPREVNRNVEMVSGIHAVLVEKETPATAFSFGFPISFTRADNDFYPMMIANSWLGQHRSSFSHLYQVMREARGMNYGDYSYIEHFAAGGRNSQPPTNNARRHQIFQIWIRPVPAPFRHFALRQAVRELQTLIDKGMTQEDFELTRNFLLNFRVNLAQSNSEQLGYALDDRFYGLSKPFLEQMKNSFAALKLEDVNNAIRKHLNTKNMMIAVVTQDAASFQEALVKNTPSPITYDSPKPDKIMKEDKIIQNYPLEIKAENVTIIPTDKIFE